MSNNYKVKVSAVTCKLGGNSLEILDSKLLNINVPVKEEREAVSVSKEKLHGEDDMIV